MKQKSLIKNAAYNFIYTGLNLFFPLITSPYISRVLGAANLGKVNFATSIVNWFILFAVFGTTTYGVREIAKNREDQKKLNIIFSEIVIINGILSLIITVIYFVLVFNIPSFQSELKLYLIMSLSILLNIFAIDWFYQGIEEYRYITIRSAIFKIFSLICIFLFIKQEDNYVIYGFISVLSTSLSGILNYIYSKKYVAFTMKGVNPIRHIKKLSVFFIHTFIVSIYTNLDQTLLGFLNGPKSVAFMNRSKTVTNMAIAISTSISNATLARSSYYVENNKDKFNQLLKIIPKIILWITIPVTVGCIIFSPNIMYILGGVEFIESATLLQIISGTIIFVPLSTYLQNQILIPTGKEKIGLFCAILSSAVSLILNIIFIPKIGFIGAGISILVAEFIAVISRYIIITKYSPYDINFFNKSTYSYIVSAIVMGIISLIIQNNIANIYLSFLFGTITGALVYFTILFILKEKVTIMVLGKLKLKK